MDSEKFYAVRIDEKNPLSQCEVASDEDVVLQKLIIKQICLGEDAVEGEFNVVQVETRINEKEAIKIPIAVLKAGETRMICPNLEFPKYAVTFKLIQGKGPVYIHGHQYFYGVDSGDWYGDGDEEEEEHYITENGS